jgi:hypothetical protein
LLGSRVRLDGFEDLIHAETILIASAYALAHGW